MTTDAPDSIAYGRLMHRAMRGLIQTVLEDVAERGLPGEHHFFITFDTRHGDVDIADWLRDRYPDEMTIVVQNWFDDLRVDDAGFWITLNFGDSPEALRVPFDAILTFVDPPSNSACASNRRRMTVPTTTPRATGSTTTMMTRRTRMPRSCASTRSARIPDSVTLS